MKKLLALVCLLALAAGLVPTAGAEGEVTYGKHDKIVVWTLAADLKQFAERYTELTGNEVEVLEIQSGDYPTKLNAALGGKSSDVDVIVGEPQMLPNFFEAGYFADLTAYNPDTDALVDYVYDIGSDENGTLRALSYQMTPGSVIFRRDLAQEIWGTDDPDAIAEKFSSFEQILTSAREAKEKGYRLLGDQGSIRWFSNADGPWVVDGVVNISDARMDYFDTAVALYQEGLVARCLEWSSAWYASMAGPLPLDSADWENIWGSSLEENTEFANAEFTEVVSYIMPTWGALIIRDNAKDNTGKFALCSGATSFFQGGTFLGINEYSNNKDAAWDFVKFVTLDEATQTWWIEASGGDVVSMKSVLDANADYENPAFGGQATYQFYLKEAERMNLDDVTKYDQIFIDNFGAAIEDVAKGNKSKEQAMEDFQLEIEMALPELTWPEN